MAEGEKVEIITVPPDAGRRARERGVNEMTPQEREAWFAEHGTPGSGEGAGAPENASQRPTGALVRCPAQAFMDEEEELARPLVGERPDKVLLSAGGTLLMYGKGGAGKTTLTLDAMCHLASGTDWLGIPVPHPLRIILIENEGVRAMLRKRLRDKQAAWTGEPWVPRVEVLVDPWTEFSFLNEAHCQQLADWITDFKADLVIVGPLVTIGAVGAGTPEDVHKFEVLLRDTQSRTDHEVAFWIVHHENKAGDVSGAWDRVPDAMLHVKSHGNGETHIHFDKARYHDPLHATSLDLTWGDGYSFAIKDTTAPTPEELMAKIRELFDQDDQWRILNEVREAIGASTDSTRQALTTLTERGELAYQQGPPGRSKQAKCWRRQTEPNYPTELPLVETEFGEFGTQLAGLTCAEPNSGSGGNVVPPPPVRDGEPATDDPDDEFPF